MVNVLLSISMEGNIVDYFDDPFEPDPNWSIFTPQLPASSSNISLDIPSTLDITPGFYSVLDYPAFTYLTQQPQLLSGLSSSSLSFSGYPKAVSYPPDPDLPSLSPAPL